MLSVQEALAQLLSAARVVPETETLALTEAHERILAEDLLSPMNVPAHANSAMDGYAVRAADLDQASTAEALSSEALFPTRSLPTPSLPAHSSPIRLAISQRIAAGQVGAPLTPGTCARIFTGAWLPEGADAVVMQEQVRLETEAEHPYAVFSQAVTPGQYVRPAGEDLCTGQVLLHAGERLTPAALALLASVGLEKNSVSAPFSGPRFRRRVRVALFFTGDELVMPGTPWFPGAVYNSNYFSLRAMLEKLGCVVDDFGQVPDDLSATVATLQRASAHNDLVLTCGGVSVGEADHVKAAVEKIGRVALWQIAVKPGKPLAFGQLLQSNTFFIGLPGNPVSAFVTFLLFALPFIRKLQGARHFTPRAYGVPADFDWPQPDPQRQEYLRVSLNEAGAAVLAGKQTSGVMTSVARASGLVEVLPATPIQRGELLRFFPFSEFL